jgi:hypothetical protein
MKNGSRIVQGYREETATADGDLCLSGLASCLQLYDTFADFQSRLG